jgi:hypothetical protein
MQTRTKVCDERLSIESEHRIKLDAAAGGQLALHCRFTFRSVPDLQLTIIALSTGAVTHSGWVVQREWDRWSCGTGIGIQGGVDAHLLFSYQVLATGISAQ